MYAAVFTAPLSQWLVRACGGLCGVKLPYLFRLGSAFALLFHSPRLTVGCLQM